MPNTSTVAPAADTALPDDDLQLLTMAEVGQKIGLKPWAVQKLCESGDLRSVYVTRKARRVRVTDLREYIAALPTERPEPAAS